ncbi:MAG: UDP-N-acetylmuramoyl-L-alanyl-D-glutamate--2,6-diaminopimelate ligase [Candidatus Promineifilaceae bacterium]|nr:UDP-N-acetylmuramoyl-L-alanyl-D-glutamate--2,6-diaminopimelate ligase [Candidatus Promineifilaceae bacterium]
MMSDAGRSLKQLLADWKKVVDGTNHPQPPRYEGPDVWITKLTEKTGEVEIGACFVARVRESSDGHPYIGKAIALGAMMILAQRSPAELNLDRLDQVVFLQVPDTAIAVAWLAAAWEGFPSHDLLVTGITGTDGKTSTANVLFEIMRSAGLKAGLLSTLKAVIGDVEEPLALHVTTPEAPTVQRYLRRMVDAGLTHCIIESTSHGLAQHRVGAIDFDVAVVTNITHEHLDYHGSYEEYFAAKSRLFNSLTLDNWMIESRNPVKESQTKTAVLNVDDASFQMLNQIPVPRILTYGLWNEAQVMAKDLKYKSYGTSFSLVVDAALGVETIDLKNIMASLAGEFNVYNILAAVTAGLANGLGLEPLREGVQKVKSISGRMEPIDLGQPFLVLVDFAHTPNALEKAIKAARAMIDGRVIAVFGSAGKRDVEKRRLMAQVSARLADLTVLTAEDPRTESLEDILAAMAEGCLQWGGEETKSFWRVPDRGEAIYLALSLARADDIVLICGKGHEQSMCFGTIEYPWDDREATRTALSALSQGQPMPDLGLPTFRTS